MTDIWLEDRIERLEQLVEQILSHLHTHPVLDHPADTGVTSVAETGETS